VPLNAARGRVLAADVVSPVNVPPFDNSAVDGYAVRAADLGPAGETTLTVIDRIMAGHGASRALGAGEAARIFTGAPVPEGADTIFMQEDTRTAGNRVVVPSGLKRHANYRFAGEDVKADAVILPEGRRLAAQHIALAAAAGLTTLSVRRRVRVALFSTGDEIIEPGSPLSRAALYDSNRYLLLNLLAGFGADVSDLGILRDEPAHLSKAISDAARTHDLVLTSGGVSTGEADHVREVIEKLGKLVFWRVAIKPGRPVAMGVLPGAGKHSAAFAGLPGNPVAAFVTFVRVVRPLLLRLGGALPEPLDVAPARATFKYRKKKDRREYVRVFAKRNVDGILEVTKYPREGAGLLSSLTETDGFAEIAEDVTNIEPGDTVGFLPYGNLIS